MLSKCSSFEALLTTTKLACREEAQYMTSSMLEPELAERYEYIAMCMEALLEGEALPTPPPYPRPEEYQT